MNKKAQITTYIIIGIVLIAVIATGVYLGNNYLKNKTTETPAEVQTDTAKIQTFTDQCIKNTLEDALLQNSLQGGYYYLNDGYISTPDLGDIPFYYYNGTSLMPTQEDVELQYALYIDDNLDYCLEGYDSFKKDLDVYAEAPDSYVTFTEKVNADVKMNVKITKGTSINEMTEFRAEYPARMKDVYEVAQEIVDAIVSDPYNIDYTNLFYLMDMYEVQIDMINYEDGLIVYVIQDGLTTVHDGPVVYLFAVQVNMDGTPVISYSGLTAKVGEEFSYYLPVSSLDDSTLVFSDDTSLFDIDPVSGLIKFVPAESQKGTHTIKIIVSDSKGSTTKELVMTIE